MALAYKTLRGTRQSYLKQSPEDYRESIDHDDNTKTHRVNVFMPLDEPFSLRK